MPVTAPIRDLKDTARFSRLVHESAEPVVVTKNGYADFVAVKPDEYHELEKARFLQGIYEALAISERQLDEGQGIDARSSLKTLRERYGL